MRATVLSLLPLLLVACPKPPVEPEGEKIADERPATKGAQGHEIKSVKLPKSMVIGDNVSLSGFYEDDGAGMGEEPAEKTTDERPSQASKAGAGPSQNLYRVVAPATVIVRSQRGYGTGVIYDPAGWILTNNHVIAHAELDNFRMKVSVGVGRLSKEGVMEQTEESLDAYVYKKDPLRDLAVIKLVKPPKNLVAIRISDTDPVPGQAVTSIGHAGIGLLWAIKDGQVAAIGKLSKQLAELQLYESLKRSKQSGLSAAMKERKLAELRKYLESKIPALVIQSTCDISQGDSGGPLVNSRAELVGLNAFVRSTMAARKESNFHIHVAEVRKFIKDVPKRAPQLLPDPWTEGGAVASMGDADLDGAIDVLALYQSVRYGLFQRKTPGAYFVDLDQDSFQGRVVPDVKQVMEKKDFDAELIFLTHGNYLYAWYDTNNDKKPDVLLLADGMRKEVKEAYRIDTAGELSKDDALVAGKLIRPRLFADAAMGERLANVGGDLFGHHLMPAGIAAGRKFPDPIKSAGHKGTLRDLNRDGKPDTVAAEGMFSTGFVFDVDQDSLGGHKVGASLAELGGRIDAEFSWISLKGGFWAFYDTDNDGSFDLLLHTHRYPMNVVNEAWRIGADGKHTPDPTQLGRLMVQPELLGAQAGALRSLASQVLPSDRVASGGGIKAFPDPSSHYRWGYRLKDVKRWKGVAVEVRLSRCQGLLVDVDRDTPRKAKKAKRTMEEMVRDQKFDAEYAQVACGSDFWTFYDSKGSGSWDVVVYTSQGAAGKPEAAYVVDGKGEVAPRTKTLGCQQMAIPGLFRKPAHRAAFAKIGAELLRNVADVKCKP